MAELWQLFPRSQWIATATMRQAFGTAAQARVARSTSSEPSARSSACGRSLPLCWSLIQQHKKEDAMTTGQKKTRKFVEVKSDLPPKWEPAIDESIEGIYLGAKRLKLSGGTSFLTYQLQDEETGVVISYAGAIADRMMSRIPQGAFVRVTYLGTIKVGQGQAKNFKIEAEEGTHVAAEGYEQDDEQDHGEVEQDTRGVYRGGRVERDERARTVARNATR